MISSATLRKAHQILKTDNEKGTHIQMEKDLNGDPVFYDYVLRLSGAFSKLAKHLSRGYQGVSKFC